jgi:glycosyltransferase involved in cell wall biosynthesis
MPSVSVIVPVYNRAALLEQALDSVASQTYRDFEVLVVDDGSLEETWRAVGRFRGRLGQRLFYVYQRNLGISGARNTGCRLARGRYLAFLDSDDLWKPHKLAVQVPVLDRDEGIGLVSSMAEVIDEAGRFLRIKPRTPPGDTLEEMVARGTAPPSTFVARREALAEIGYFDPAFRGMNLEDLDLGLRLAATRWRIVCLEEPLVRYRVHDGNVSADEAKTYRGYVRAYEKLLALPAASVPRRLAARMAARYHYLLGTTLFRQGATRSALAEVLLAVRRAPLVGLEMERPRRPWFHLGAGALKPYAVIVALALASLVGFRHRVGPE